MGLNRILSIIAVLLGFFGSILLAKGTLKLTPTIIAKQSQAYWSYNKSQLDNITSQKADFICGISLIFLAFLIQIINLIFIHDSLKIFSFRSATILIVCSVSPILIITYLINKFLVKKYGIDSRKALAREWLQECSKQQKISYSNWESILRGAEDLCNIRKEDGEPTVDFLKRYSLFLGVKIPSDIDLSELPTEENKTGNG